MLHRILVAFVICGIFSAPRITLPGVLPEFQSGGRASDDVVPPACPPRNILYGDSACDLFGFSAAFTGDQNNHGIADYLIGTPYNDAALQTIGWVRVHSGANGLPLDTLLGEPINYPGFGYSVADVGDVAGVGRCRS